MAFAAPYLTCANYANDDNKPTSFLVAMDGGAEIEVAATTNADGTVKLRYDLASISSGSHSAVIKAKNIWGTSAASAAYPFTKAVPNAPTSVGLSAN